MTASYRLVTHFESSWRYVLAERLDAERKTLVAELQKINSALSLVECAKRDALTKVYRRGFGKSDACAQTNEIEARFHKDRAPVIREKAAIEERINDVKNQMKSSSVREDIAVLKRIETLLVEIRDRLPSQQQKQELSNTHERA
jgi:hypothetical protein